MMSAAGTGPLQLRLYCTIQSLLHSPCSFIWVRYMVHTLSAKGWAEEPSAWSGATSDLSPSGLTLSSSLLEPPGGWCGSSLLLKEKDMRFLSEGILSVPGAEASRTRIHEFLDRNSDALKRSYLMLFSFKSELVKIYFLLHLNSFSVLLCNFCLSL